MDLGTCITGMVLGIPALLTSVSGLSLGFTALLAPHTFGICFPVILDFSVYF